MKRRSGFTERDCRTARTVLGKKAAGYKADPMKRASRVWGACRTHARKWRYELGLTRAEVEELVCSECHYCGHLSPGGNGIDRVDSMEGYRRDNAVPCCTQCNMVLSDLPPPAKRIVQPALAELRKHDYFGWTPGTVRSDADRKLSIEGMGSIQIVDAIASVRAELDRQRRSPQPRTTSMRRSPDGTEVAPARHPGSSPVIIRRRSPRPDVLPTHSTKVLDTE